MNLSLLWEPGPGERVTVADIVPGCDSYRATTTVDGVKVMWGPGYQRLGLHMQMNPDLYFNFPEFTVWIAKEKPLP